MPRSPEKWGRARLIFSGRDRCAARRENGSDQRAATTFIEGLNMPEFVTFPSEGSTATGYLAKPPKRSGPGLVVIQEWWGLDPGIKEMCDRLAEGGFMALAPDLYRGEIAQHTEMDRAAELMQKLPPERAGRDMSAAIDYLLKHPGVTSQGVGVVGFCMGGMLSFIIAANRPDAVKAVAPFYGFPQGAAEPDWSTLAATVRGHMAERDDYFSPAAARALEAKLRKMGKDVTLTVHPGTGHAFMAPHNALGTYDAAAAAKIWPQLIAFLRDTLKS
jgi:carboxymethylenebutenolidase